MVRCAVHALLKEMSQSKLSFLSPLSQSAISNIANWKYSHSLSVEKCQEFGKWYMEYKKTIPQDFSEAQPRDSRLTFHPEHEIPQLRSWYKRYKNPSDKKLEFFASELNRGHVRQDRPKITIEKLKNWWKNEKQREKRISLEEEDSKDKEKKEIDKLKFEAAKSAARRKFTDQDSEKVKVAKVVPSPQKSSEPRSAAGQVDQNLSAPQTSIQQSFLISSQPQTVSPSLNRQRGDSVPEIQISFGRPSTIPTGFVSLLQQSPITYDNRPGSSVAVCGPVARISPAIQRPGLAMSGPVARIDHGNVQMYRGADRSEIRSCDFRSGQIRPMTHSVVGYPQTENSGIFEETNPDG